MKKIKRIVAVLSALMIMIVMSVTAFAATQELSVNDSNGNTYSAYQVMKATKVSDEGEEPLYSYEVNEVFKAFFVAESGTGYSLTANNEIVKTGETTAIAGDGRWTNTNTTESAKLASALEKYVKDNNIAASATMQNKAFSSLDEGYYLVVETASGSSDQTEVASKPVLVNLVGESATITPKNSSTSLEKKIVEGEERVDENTVNIGDTIKYEIKTNIPSYEANVDKTALSFVLTDTFSEGLTYTADSLSIAGFTKDTDYTVSVVGQVLTITFRQEAIYSNQGKEVVATYSAVLNKNAVVNGANPNEVKLEYANNTNVEDSKKTLKDDVKTYTFGFGVHKVDGADNTDLPNAEFELTKDGSATPISFIYEKGTNGKPDTYTVAPEGTGGTTTTIKSVAGEAPVIKGLDEGTYSLTETKAPDEYAKLANPVTVKIEGVKDSEGKYTGQDKITVSGGSATAEQGDSNSESTVTSTEGTIDINVFVKNTKGISLPETGSKAAMYCMILGAIVVAFGLAYYEISRRKAIKK